MKLVARLALFAGLVVVLVLLAREGVGTTLGVLSAAGPVLLWLVPLRLFALSFDVLGYRELIGRRLGGPLLLWIATVREAVNRLLPVASVGGELAGIRLVAAHGVPGAEAAASIVVEVLLNVSAQYVFALLGLGALLALTGRGALGLELGVGLAASLPLVVGLALLLRHGAPFARLERLAARVLGDDNRVRNLLGGSAELDLSIGVLFAHRRRLVVAAAGQLACLLASVLETWCGLRWLGAPVSLTAAVALESLSQAARQFLFVVPAGLGVQEAGIIGLGSMLGIGSDVALALSLAKRMRELLLGIPALASWYWYEERRGLRRQPV